MTGVLDDNTPAGCEYDTLILERGQYGKVNGLKNGVARFGFSSATPGRLPS